MARIKRLTLALGLVGFLAGSQVLGAESAAQRPTREASAPPAARIAALEAELAKVRAEISALRQKNGELILEIGRLKQVCRKAGIQPDIVSKPRPPGRGAAPKQPPPIYGLADVPGLNVLASYSGAQKDAWIAGVTGKLFAISGPLLSVSGKAPEYQIVIRCFRHEIGREWPALFKFKVKTKWPGAIRLRIGQSVSFVGTISNVSIYIPRGTQRGSVDQIDFQGALSFELSDGKILAG